MAIVDCHKCPLVDCCKQATGHFQDVNNCPLAHTVYTQVKDWGRFPLDEEFKPNAKKG